MHKAYIFLLVLLAGCSTTAETPQFSETLAKYEALTKPYPERVPVNIDADCEDGMCELPEHNVNNLLLIIEGLRNEVDRRIDAYNSLLTNGMAHCEYSGLHDKAQISALEQAGSRQALTSSIRELALGGICGVLLLGK